MSRYRKLEIGCWIVGFGCAASFAVSSIYNYGFLYRGFIVENRDGCGSLWILAGPQTVPDYLWFYKEPSPKITWIPPLLAGGTTPGDILIYWPYWAPVVVAGLAGIIFHLRAKIGAGVCRSCRYNLTGNTSGVCPECGTTIIADT